MGYAPVTHAKEARMSTLIVDDTLNMGNHHLRATNILEAVTYSDIRFYNDVRIHTIKEVSVGTGTRILNPASTAVFTLAASDTVRASDLSTPYEGSHTTLTKISELEVPMYYKSGTVRVKVSAAISNLGFGGEVHFYVDGIEAGSLHTFGSTSYFDFSDDIEVTPGARIQVYGIINSISGKIYVKDFQICADDVIHNGIKGALW